MQNKALALIHKALAALVFAWIALFFAALPALAQTTVGGAGSQLKPVPELSGRVIDQTNTLSSSDVQALSEKLKTLEDETGAQVVILMVGSTAPEDIAAYSWRVANDWKLGRKDIGDGSLIVVAKDERRMRIEVARKLEGAIPDIMAGRIIDETMQPHFQADDYAGGLGQTIDQLSLLIHGEKLPEPSARSIPTDNLTMVALFWLLGAPLTRWLLGRIKASLLMGVLSCILVLVIERSSLHFALGAGVIGFLITLLGLFRLSGFGGKRGGGFKSGGGGRFGGGGASGGW